MVRSAARAAQLLFHSNDTDDACASATTSDLLAFCAVKGVMGKANVWDRTHLLQQARDYMRDERLARTKNGAHWAGLQERQRMRLLHAVCNGEGDATYIDPASGYTVFSAFAHLKRGHCCGVSVSETDGTVQRTHRCRHCPYTQDGAVSGAVMMALKQRLRVVELVRERTADALDGAVSLSLSHVPAAAAEAVIEPATSEATTDGAVGAGTGAARSAEDMARLRRKLVKPVKAPLRPPSSSDMSSSSSSPAAMPGCDTCGDERYTTCTRCNGWTIVFSPRVAPCTQCKGEGMHRCMQCTSFRPPQITSLYS